MLFGRLGGGICGGCGPTFIGKTQVLTGWGAAKNQAIGMYATGGKKTKWKTWRG